MLKMAKVLLEYSLQDPKLSILELATFKPLENSSQVSCLFLIHGVLLIKKIIRSFHVIEVTSLTSNARLIHIMVQLAGCIGI